MNSRRVLIALLIATACMAARPQPAPPHALSVSGSQFLMDGKPYQVISGEMHYPRVPRAYWRNRFRQARAMGLNTITTYVFWNLHEPRPGVYDFSGQNDVAEYLREAQEEGLHVILRPGPYVCAEWELGGYPAWLLKDRSLTLRSSDPKYSAAVRTWFARLAQEIKPLLAKNGGPIVAVQVENEYGSFGDDRAYLEGVRKALLDSGMGDSLLYTADSAERVPQGSLPEQLAVINFGTGDAQKSFAKFAQIRPEGPRMSGEYWAGWFDKWGEKHHETDGAKEAAEFRWMLEQGYSVSLYMFHGGSSFGWMNGADSHTGKDYHPDTTSYDYDAPLDERGEPRYKFELFRKAIAETTHQALPPVLKPTPRTAFPIATDLLTASLWRNLPAPIHANTPLTFEDLDQAYGYVLYRTSLAQGDGGQLVLEGLHDYAQVYVDQQLLGTLDRRLGTDTLDLPRQSHAATLDILVENTGRVNYSKAILTERAGLGSVSLDGKPFAGWDMFSLPMNDPRHLRYLSEPCTGPCFFQARMQVTTPADTYLDTRGLHKGQLWVGEHNLGRFWSVGPQYTLYTPAPWLETGTTTVTFFDLLGDATDHLLSTTNPVYGEAINTRENQ